MIFVDMQIIIICKLETLIYSQIDYKYYASKNRETLTLIAYIKCCGYDFFKVISILFSL